MMQSAASWPDFKREKHAGRIERVDEAPRVADEDPAVAGGLFRCVRILLDDVEPGDLLGAVEPLGDRRAIGDFLGKDLVGRAAALQQMSRRRRRRRR